jgi:uncharacterized protein YndB with AHSA1/START domain
MDDQIERRIEINAPVSRVWRALTDYNAFGEWFRVRIDQPFAPGQASTGRMTVPGYEHVKWEATVERVEPERLFAFSWHPYAVDPDRDYSSEPPTLVEFRLEPTTAGTRLTVTESGFDRIPVERRPEALRMNSKGWPAQLRNIGTYVTEHIGA